MNVLKTKEQDTYFITVLSVLSSLAVVFLHANGCFWSFEYSRTWVSANAIECLFYFAVPVFFMISGATLLDYRDKYDTRTYVRKRVKKTVIPFFVWSIIALIFDRVTNIYVLDRVTLWTIWDSIINTRAWSIFWFFPALWAVYLTIPVVSLIPKEKRRGIFQYLILVGFLLNGLLPFINRLFDHVIPMNGAINLPLVAGNLQFVLIGYYIHHYNLPRWGRWIVYGLGLVGLGLHFFGTWYCSYQVGAIADTFKGYLNVPSILYSSVIFLMFRNLNLEAMPAKAKKVVLFFSTETCNVYLTHLFIHQVLTRYCHVDARSLLYRTLGAVLVFLVAVVGCKCAKKIPLVRHLFT